MAHFFAIASKTIEAEDERFFSSMERAAAVDANHCYAGCYPPGLNSYLYEEGIVFLVFRALLDEHRNFPFEVVWEHDYPVLKGGRMDLGIFERTAGERPRLVGAVEAKWWKGDAQVRADLKKLRRLPPAVRKFMLLFGTWQNATSESIADSLLKFDLAPRSDWIHLSPIQGRSIPAKYRWSHFYVILLEVPAPESLPFREVGARVALDSFCLPPQ